MAYGRELPKSKNEQLYDMAPPAFTTYQSQSGNPTVSSVITLNDRTTVIELMAIGGNNGNAGIIGKWGVGSVTGTNFDIQVNSGQTRQFVVPQSVFGNISSVAGANVANGLYNSLSVKQATPQPCSVLSIEY